MPTLSMFYGIIVTMYYQDHQPPHFHARYQGQEATFDLEGKVLSGILPNKQLRYIEAWALIHHDELLANWEIAKEMGQVYKIDPLR